MSNYTAPTWQDDAAPPINSEALTALCETVQNSQILTGDSDPASTTAGNLGQLYCNTSTNNIFLCTRSTPPTYTWTPMPSILSGTSAPTTSTVGASGQLYFQYNAGFVGPGTFYYCKGNSENPSNMTYTWLPLVSQTVTNGDPSPVSGGAVYKELQSLNTQISEVETEVTEISDNIISGTWTPAFTSSHVSSYNYQNGWYQKIGNVVTVGFSIGANITNGSTTTALTLTGLPFSSTEYAAGGGISSGARANSGHVFMGYFLTPGNSNINIRSIETSSGVQYADSVYEPSSGLVICAGTISYTTAS